MKVYLYAKTKFEEILSKADTQVWSLYDGDIDFWFEAENIAKLSITIFEAKQIQKEHKNEFIEFWIEPINQ